MSASSSWTPRDQEDVREGGHAEHHRDAQAVHQRGARARHGDLRDRRGAQGEDEKVYFEGNQAFTQKKLRKVIKTRRWNWISWLTGSGKFNEDEFAEDRDRLRDFYASNGYVDFEIKDVEFERPKTNKMIITIDVAEGTQYRVGTVTFEGTSGSPRPRSRPIFAMIAAGLPRNG